VTVLTLHRYDRLSSDPRVKKAFSVAEQNGAQRSEPATLFASGEPKSFVKAELPLEDTDRA